MLKETEICGQLIESIDTLHEAIYQVYSIAFDHNYAELYSVLEISKQLSEKIFSSMTLLYPEHENIARVNDSIVNNIIASNNNILRLSKVRSPKLLDKIQFELLPLVKLLYITFYYVAFIEGDESETEKFISGMGHDLFLSESMKTGMETGKYKYDVSIMILAYNKLEYTKLCLESILKNTPAHINYELILVNHGSTDGTKEYFESMGCTKQIDLYHNGLSNVIALQAMEGKFLCSISNDIVVGEHYLDNMLACFESDLSIKYVVPTTSNISNLQSIPCDFDNLEDMEKFAKKNNRKNPYRWEQRVRLINPISVYKNDFFFQHNVFIKSYLRLRVYGAFGDDYFSLCVRRAGGKCILAKDSFCYHFGSVTLKKDIEYNKRDNLQEGREVFKKFTGIDPWGIGFCYDDNLIQSLSCNNKEAVNILGINCGLGSNPLKIRESIKENTHNCHVKIYSLTDDEAYLEDLHGVSDFVDTFRKADEIKVKFPTIKFDYIIFESNHNHFEKQLLSQTIIPRLAKNGVLCSLGLNLGAACSVDSLIYPNEKWYITTDG